MVCKFINFIKTKVITNRWCNSKAGNFELDLTGYRYHFNETTKDLNCYLYAESEKDEYNTPIIIQGFITFLIDSWGKDELTIYKTYNETRKQQFLAIEAKKPGSFKRDLDKEFIKRLIDTEQDNINHFQKDFDYIPLEEKSLIIEYANNYLEYTTSVYKLKAKSKKVEETFENLLYHDPKHALMEVLHQLLDNSQGKKVAIVIKALIKLGYLNIPGNRSELYTIMSKTFGNIGTAQNLNNYLRPDSHKIADTELESTIEILKKV